MKKLKLQYRSFIGTYLSGTLSGCAAFQKFDASGSQRPVWTQRTKVSLMNIKLTKQTKEDAEKTYNQNLELATQQLTAVGVSEELSKNICNFSLTCLKIQNTL